MAHAAIGQHLDIPPAVLLRVADSSPPPPPEPHLPRPILFPELALKLGAEGRLAVVGYPKSGKTVLLANFARSWPGPRIWLTVPRWRADSGSHELLLRYQLGSATGATTIGDADLRDTIQRLSVATPVLVVVDDAHLLPDVATLRFLSALVATSGGRFSLVLVAADEAPFLVSVRTEGIPDWRPPGLSEVEAESYARLNRLELTDNRRVAIRRLTRESDGHVGILRQLLPAVSSIETRENLRRFLAQNAGERLAGSGLRASLVSNFRRSLEPPVLDLCRHLSIAIGPFRRRFAEALWRSDRPDGTFAATWDPCVAAVLDIRDGDRCSLPDLYQGSLLEDTSAAERQRWHHAAADELGRPQGELLDPIDVYVSIRHRLEADEPDTALSDAAAFLVLAKRSGRATARFLLDRFGHALAGHATNPAVRRGARLRWLVARRQAANEISDPIQAELALQELLSALRGNGDADSADEAMGWGAVLAYAAEAGKSDLAVEAVKHLPIGFIGTDEPRLRGGAIALAMSAFVVERRDPLPFLRWLLDRPPGCAGDREEFWNPKTGFSLWRGVETLIYTVDAEACTDSSRLGYALEELRRVERLASGRHLPEIATLLGAAAVRLLIDVGRDFAAAMPQAEQLFEFVISDKNVAAYRLHIRGDALRCAGDRVRAAEDYRAALAIWPERSVFDRGQSELMLAITLAQAGQVHEAISGSLRAAALFSNFPHRSTESAALALMETAVMAVAADRIPRAVRCLIEAHAHLSDDTENDREWPALAAVAAHVAMPATAPGVIPKPGFTLGIPGHVEGAEKMFTYAPTMMVAMACERHGRPHRALSYLRRFPNGSMTPEQRASAASVAFDSAVQVGDLATAAVAAARASAMPWSDDPSTPEVFGAFLWERYVGGLLPLAISAFDESAGAERLATAETAVAAEMIDHPIALAIVNVLEAVKSALAGDADRLDHAFRDACDRKASTTARQLAWFWMFRYAVGRPLRQLDFLRWQWRLSCFVLLLERSAPESAAALMGQIEILWNRLARSNDLNGLEQFLALLRSDRSREGKLTSAVEILAELHERSGFAVAFCGELELVAKCGVTLPRATFDAAITGLLDLVLNPSATRLHGYLEPAVSSLQRAVEGTRARSELDDVATTVIHLHWLSEVVIQGCFLPGMLGALLGVESRIGRLSESSEANWYVWLRHSIGEERITPDQYAGLVGRLLTSRAGELAASEGVHRRIRAFLRICRGASMGYRLLGRLMEAGQNPRRRIDQLLLPPAGVAARNKNDTAGILDAAERVATDLDAVERDGVDDEVSWSAAHERGLIRRSLGSVLTVRGDPRGREWLAKALGDFEKAIEHAHRRDDDTTAFRSAVDAVAVAEYLQSEGREELRQIVRRLRERLGEDNYFVVMADRAQEGDPLTRDPSNESRFLSLDEDGIAKLAQFVLDSQQLPEDGRENVVDDIRKHVLLEQEQQSFCRHLRLIPSEYDSGLSGCFVSRSKYTCGCALLEHRTVIEQEDAGIVVDAMKRAYCRGCAKQDPGDRKYT